MSEPSEEVRFSEPPGGFLTYPVNKVVALMDNPDDVAVAIEDLIQAGFEREQIFVLCSPRGAERLDVSGGHHGLRGRLYRFREHLGGEREEIERAAKHMEGGGLSIFVPADEERKSIAAGVLASHGHDMIHYGKSHWEQLGG